ncbi:GlxA family transcriptional regulator [Albidovulum sp.]|jgi:transcriptional regulator GlxA family with amidase domain|uniref:GlxA family transcriptional regulator n=1 Tax=Albidovulum sp. TaxID=1872424 RepID=UPI003062BDD8
MAPLDQPASLRPAGLARTGAPAPQHAAGDEAAACTAHFVFLLVDNFSHLAFSCAVEPLRIANRVAGRTLYRWTLASADGVSVACSNRSVTLVDIGLEPLRHVDRLLVIAGDQVQRCTTPGILTYLRRERAAGTPLGAICSGAYVLANAGFLDGQAAAVHWEYHDLFAEVFPRVRLVRGVFVADQKVITAAGGTAAADLMLHLIAAGHGPDLATAVADQMVYNAVREASAEQRVSLQSRHGTRNPHLMRAVALVRQNIEDPLSPGRIAGALAISTRQLERLFLRHLGTSPKRFIIETRLMRARNLLVQTDQSITEVAVACGFTTPSHFSKVYRAHFGVSPVAQRSTLG